ncbi:MAG: HAD-IIIA family hydrolase [Clostridia bacterium]|nr:HAD-IIIA family hydrolase [Clostridia bacterium]
MEAIILAGGLGLRLREKVYEAPKVLAETAGKPFIFHVLEYLYRNGVTHAVLAVSYMHEKIISSVGNSFHGMTIDYSVEKEPLGTGGAIKEAMKKCNEDFVFVLNGDTVFDVDLREMYKTAKKDFVTIALKYMDNADRRGIVETENGVVTYFKEKEPGKSGTINGGIYLIDRQVPLSKKKKFSFEYDFLEMNCNRLIPFVSDGYFIDIGIPEDYERAQNEVPVMLTGRKGKAAFLDRDGTININTGHLFRQEDFIFTQNAPERIAELQKKGYYITVISNQAGVAKGMYTENDIAKLNSFINKKLLPYGVIIDAFFHCPHHPDGVVKEYTVDCDCRKPKAGMIFKAVEYYKSLGIEIDLSQSILIGDKDTDIQAGETAGVGRCIKAENNIFPEI